MMMMASKMGLNRGKWIRFQINALQVLRDHPVNGVCVELPNGTNTGENSFED